MGETVSVKHLLLLRGPSGSGKTTLATILSGVASEKVRHLEADHFFERDGKYRFDFAKLPQAHRWCQEECQFSMDKEVPLIVVANTFTQNWELRPYIDMAQKSGYTYSVVTVESGYSESGLAARNVHNVPLESIQKMTKRWEQFRL